MQLLPPLADHLEGIVQRDAAKNTIILRHNLNRKSDADDVINHLSSWLKIGESARVVRITRGRLERGR